MSFKLLEKIINDVDAAIEKLQLKIETLEEKIDDLEGKQADRETEARALRLDELGEQKYLVETQIEALEAVKDAAEEAINQFEAA